MRISGIPFRFDAGFFFLSVSYQCEKRMIPICVEFGISVAFNRACLSHSLSLSFSISDSLRCRQRRLRIFIFATICHERARNLISLHPPIWSCVRQTDEDERHSSANELYIYYFGILFTLFYACFGIRIHVGCWLGGQRLMFGIDRRKNRQTRARIKAKKSSALSFLSCFMWMCARDARQYITLSLSIRPTTMHGHGDVVLFRVFLYR